MMAAAILAVLLSAASQAEALRNFQVPIHFETNRGQTDARVRFLSRGGGYQLFVTDSEAVLVLGKAGRDARRRWEAGATAELEETGPDQPEGRQAVVRQRLLGGHPQARIEGLEEQPGTVNYLIGPDPAGWRTGVPTYARVRYEAVYPGIDLVYYGRDGRLEYDFVVAPGADPGLIRVGLSGGEDLRVSPQGDLILDTAAGQIRQSKPVIYQEDGAGGRREIAGEYRLLGPGEFSFEVGEYDPGQVLVIDPLIYSTYLGGSSFDVGWAIAVDAAGQSYIAGTTSSIDFPTTAGALQTAAGGDGDAFVSKLAADGATLLYSTYLGGSGFDSSQGIAVDAGGQAYITGQTAGFPNDFPTTTGAFQTAPAGVFDAFVAKLADDGASLVYSTYLGGTALAAIEIGFAIAVDAAGQAHVTGITGSADFPTTAGAFQTTYGGGFSDVFVAKLADDGGSLVYSTYLGGSDSEDGLGLTVDATGQAHVTGNTSSNDFPTTPGAVQTVFGGDFDAFVTRLADDGSLLYSTFLGGGGGDRFFGIAVDSDGDTYLAGRSFSDNFPTTPGALQSTRAGERDVIVTKLAADGSELLYSTYLGGSDIDIAYGLALDRDGQVHISGETSSADFPTTPGAFQTTFGGGLGDALITRLNEDGSSLLYSSYLGGSDFDRSFGIQLDAAGSAYITGETGSTDFPTTPGVFQTANGGERDAFVAKLSLVTIPQPVLLCAFECLAEPAGRLWQEITALALANPFADRVSARADLFFYDGQNGDLGCSSTVLSLGDLDVIQVCETLDRALPAGAPPSGLVQVLLELSDEARFRDFSGLQSPSAAWVKNFTGAFPRGEPANGTVRSAGKSACQLVWRRAEPETCDPSGALPLVFIEESAEEDP